MTVLLDANVLIARAIGDHVHHGRTEVWLSGLDERHATCPMTQGALLRMLIRQSMPASAAVSLLSALTADDRHEFWPDSIAFSAVRMSGVVGHQQVTDAYLAGLARARAGRLATLDDGLAALHPDVAFLVPAL